MKKLIALILAIASGLYLGFGWLPDPIPFIDEGAALLVLLNSLAYLGLFYPSRGPPIARHQHWPGRRYIGQRTGLGRFLLRPLLSQPHSLGQ